MGLGELKWEPHFKLLSDTYPDNTLDIYKPQPLGIRLVSTPFQYSTADVKVLLPYIKGDKGDQGEVGPQGPKGDIGPQGLKGDKGDTGNGFTEEQSTKLNELPTKTELDASLASKQPAITPSDDIAPLGSDKLALTDKAKMAELKATAKAAGVDYNVNTGYFEYNTLVDITAEELRDMLSHINEIFLPGGRTLTGSKARTNIVTASSLPKDWGGDFVSLNGLLVKNYNLEILKLGDVQVQGPTVAIFCYLAFRLKKILGEIDVRAVTRFLNAFEKAPLLSDITLYGLKCSVAFSDCPLLSLTSIQYMVDHAANTTPITITLHPDAHARLTEELIAQAAEKQITFATT